MDWNKKRRGELREGGKISRRDKGRGTRNVRGRMRGARSKTCQGKKRGKGGLGLEGAPS